MNDICKNIYTFVIERRTLALTLLALPPLSRTFGGESLLT